MRQLPQQGFIHQDFSRAEAIGGLFWLSLGALISVFLEVMYLGTWIALPGGSSIAFPYTILIAFFFTMVLSRTAALWSNRAVIAAIPLYVWVAGYTVMMMWPVFGDAQLLGSNIRSVLLLGAGVIGGIWPLIKVK
ncbi:hypothetical protein COCCU_05225 [Corynebacterium occultum]|uniref:Uncharacterized protein n=1 Tax=Corynebacterium occultum TaxID=2675219 RepID=A0A6B8W399_9CORY|nr:hypothetical protein COCCU_05225 [Corynebacterium occultum]